MHLVVGPFVDGFEGRDERAAFVRQGVFDCGRDRALLFACDEAVLLEFAQALSKHSGRDADDFPLQFFISQRLVLGVGLS